MIEIYMLEGLEEESLRPLLEKLTKYELAYTIKKAPKKHKKFLSAYIGAAYKQAGIWGLPQEPGTIRLLLSNEKVSPILGESSGNLTCASHLDTDLLCTAALHELAHSLKAVRKKGRPLVMQVKADRKIMASTKNVLHHQEAIEKLGALYPGGVIDIDGLHCSDPRCICYPLLVNSELIKTEQPFCDPCYEGFKKGVEKLNAEFAAERNSCGDCQYLRGCMESELDKDHMPVFEDSEACDEFERVYNG